MESPNIATAKPEDQTATRNKIWKCGDPNRYSVPVTSDGNPWKVCLQPVLEEDRIKCERWEDEVQSLLLFAGLFSAVVTAFVIQSYQSLQEDASIILLATIVGQLSYLTNGTTAPHSIAQKYSNPADPSPSSIRINIYWFISLILSLMTVLIGIVALQWLREYKRHPSNLSPKRSFAARNLRAEAFDEWFVPQIIAGLPLLLQTALILFFAGLIDFLLDLNPSVAVPVIGLIGITLLFLLITTILPTLQAFWLLNARKPTSIPAQCPYKSPQSWAFLRLASSWITRFILNYLGNFAFNALLFPVAPIIWVARALASDSYLWKFIEYLQVSFKLKSLGTIRNWTQFDGFWMDERHRIFTESSKPCTYFTKLIGNTDYDAARGIAHIIDDGHTREESLALAAYHCFQQLPQVVIKDDIFKLMTQSLPGWMTSQQSTRKAAMLECPSVSMTREENEMFLLGRLPQTAVTSPIHIFRKRQLELFVRTLAYIFAGDPWLDNPEADYDLTVNTRPRIHAKAGKLLVPVCMKTPKGIDQLPIRLAADLREQLSMIFESFVAMTIAREDMLRLPNIYYSEEILGDFMQMIHTITLSTITSTQISTMSSQQHMAALSHLTAAVESLNCTLLSPASTSIHSTFYIATLYVSRFHYTEWAPIRRRAQTFSAVFKELMITLKTMEHTSRRKVAFSIHHHYYRKQWEELVEEVLPMEQEMALGDPDLQPTRTNVFAASNMVGTPVFGDSFSLMQLPAPARLRHHLRADLHGGSILPNSLV